MSNKHPSKEECFALLEQYNTPEHVVKHCVQVAETALKIASALNEKGYSLDLELIQAAALIHDIARVEEHHGEVGAEIASSLGYYQEAEIIKLHMVYNSDITSTDIAEIDIICLSDRMVKEDTYVGLEIRMQYILEKCKDNPDAIERINNRVNDNKILIQQIEEWIGTTIDSLMY